MSLTNRTLLGLAATAVTAVAAGAVTGVVRHRRRDHLHDGDDIAFGTFRASPQPVTTSDGLRLAVEVDEPSDHGPGDATVVFLHGWVLDMDSWHYQRAALHGRVRTVAYDHRSHGRSDRSDREHATLAQLADDLVRVIDATCPDGPIVLVGHSMGGMTVMALADIHPEQFDKRDIGVLLANTSAGGLMKPGTPIARAQPYLLGAAAAVVPFLALARRVGRISTAQRFAVGPDATREQAEQTAQLLARARTHVLLDFLPNFGTLDAYHALEALPGDRTVVIGGTHDQLTPGKHARRIADAVPGARLDVVEGAGHMVMLEHRDVLTRAVLDLVDEVEADARG